MAGTALYSIRPEELLAVYPHPSSLPGQTWRNLFASAEHEISVLDYNSLFLAEDAEIIRTLAEKARSGVRVRIALGGPDSQYVIERSAQEDVVDAMITEIRDALVLYRSLQRVDSLEIRLHTTVPYDSIYRADGQLLCCLHAFGISATRSPTLHLRRVNDDLASVYVNTFERTWAEARRSADSANHQ